MIECDHVIHYYFILRCIHEMFCKICKVKDLQILCYVSLLMVSVSNVRRRLGKDCSKTLVKSTRKHLQHSNDSEIYKIFRESCFIKNLRTTVSYFFPVHIEREKYASTRNPIVSSYPSLPSKSLPQAIHYPLRQNKFQLRPPLHHLHTAFLSLCIFSSILIRNLTNCKSKESNHQGIKLQFKRTFKGFTFATKKT